MNDNNNLPVLDRRSSLYDSSGDELSVDYESGDDEKQNLGLVDDDDDHSSDGHSNSSLTTAKTTSSGGGETNDGFISKRDAFAVSWSKCCFLGTLLCAATALTLVVFFTLRSEQLDDFHTHVSFCTTSYVLG